MAAHARRGTSRRTKIVAVGAVMLMLAGVAIAATLYRGRLNGSGKINASPGVVFTDASFFDKSATTDVCTASLNVAAQLVSVTFEGETPSDCTIEVKMYRKGNHDLKLQNITWADVTTEQFQPSSLCGTSLPATPAAPLSILIKFSIPTGMTEGQVFTISPDAGIEAVKAADWTLAACPV